VWREGVCLRVVGWLKRGITPHQRPAINHHKPTPTCTAHVSSKPDPPSALRLPQPAPAAAEPTSSSRSTLAPPPPAPPLSVRPCAWDVSAAASTAASPMRDCFGLSVYYILRGWAGLRGVRTTTLVRHAVCCFPLVSHHATPTPHVEQNAPKPPPPLSPPPVQTPPQAAPPRSAASGGRRRRTPHSSRPGRSVLIAVGGGGWGEGRRRPAGCVHWSRGASRTNSQPAPLPPAHDPQHTRTCAGLLSMGLTAPHRGHPPDSSSGSAKGRPLTTTHWRSTSACASGGSASACACGGGVWGGDCERCVPCAARESWGGRGFITLEGKKA